MSSVLHGSCLVSFVIFLAKSGWNSNRRIKIFIREEQMLYLDCSTFNEPLQLYIKKLNISTCTQNSFPKKIISPALHSSHTAFLPEALMCQHPLRSVLSEYPQGSSYILGFFFCAFVVFLEGETVETVSDFILGGSKITAHGDCSHEIKRHLLLGREVMTNLDSILKSRDVTLPTKVRLVKAMVFPVVMYRCESWTL